MITAVMGDGVSIQIILAQIIFVSLLLLSHRSSDFLSLSLVSGCGHIYGTIAKKITTSLSFLFSVFRLVQNSAQINLQSAVRVNISKYQNTFRECPEKQGPKASSYQLSIVLCYLYYNTFTVHRMCLSRVNMKICQDRDDLSRL